MTEKQHFFASCIQKKLPELLEAERWLWNHPQTGYTEWEANHYLAEKWEAMGYTLTRAGNIPGFYTDIDTGRPGPKVCLMGEMDALDLKGHFDAKNGMAHACGHNVQGVFMLGVAYALSRPGALDGLSGSIRLMMVPAEEMIQLNFREELRKQGIIHCFGGKAEFMYRGLFDGVDISLMIHPCIASSPIDFIANLGMNGCIAKTFRYKGKASHAGGSPDLGINAEYAALLGLQACNNLRETFRDHEAIRFHPIMHGAECAVNIIPDEIKCESFVRGRTVEAIQRENEKINRALAAGALAMGAGLELSDRPGYAPELHDISLMKLAEKALAGLEGEDHVAFLYDHMDTGSSDFGDLTCVMPGLQFSAAGASGSVHGIDYCVADPKRMITNGVNGFLAVTEALLSDNAAAGREIIANYQPRYPSIKAYFEDIDRLFLEKDAVTYDAEGRPTLDYLNR